MNIGGAISLNFGCIFCSDEGRLKKLAAVSKWRTEAGSAIIFYRGRLVTIELAEAVKRNSHAMIMGFLCYMDIKRFLLICYQYSQPLCRTNNTVSIVLFHT